MLINVISYRNPNNFYTNEYERFEKFFLNHMNDSENYSKDSVEKEPSQSMQKHQKKVAMPTKIKIFKAKPAKRQFLKRKRQLCIHVSSLLSKLTLIHSSQKKNESLSLK